MRLVHRVETAVAVAATAVSTATAVSYHSLHLSSLHKL
jgi:hypothetical protein